MILPVTGEGEYTLVTKTVDETTCNPLKLWHDMGEPAYPTAEETELIRSAANPLVGSSIAIVEDKKANVNIVIRRNGVVYFSLTERHYTPDRGYDYDKVITFH